MKKIKNIKKISALITGFVCVGTALPLALTLNSCSGGASVKVNYDTVHKLKQIDPSKGDEEDCFRDWLKLPTKTKTIDLWSGIFDDAFGQMGTVQSGARLNNFSSTHGGSKSMEDSSPASKSGLEAIFAILGLGTPDIGTVNYLIQKKIGFDVTRSTFKKATLKDCFYKLPNGAFNKMNIDTNLWSGTVKLMVYGGISGADVSGLSLVFKNVPITRFKNDMSFSVSPKKHEASEFSTMMIDNTILDTAGTELSLVIPSNLSKYIDVIKSIVSIADWQLPNDMSKYYNKKIALPNILVSSLFEFDTTNLGGKNEGFSHPMYSYIYDYVMGTGFTPGFKEYSKRNPIPYLNALDPFQIYDGSNGDISYIYMTSRSNSVVRWEPIIEFANGASANRFVNIEDFKCYQYDSSTTEAANKFASFDGTFLKFDSAELKTTDGFTSDKFDSDGFMQATVSFTIKLKNPNLFGGIEVDDEKIVQTLRIRKPYDWFVNYDLTSNNNGMWGNKAHYYRNDIDSCDPSVAGAIGIDKDTSTRINQFDGRNDYKWVDPSAPDTNVDYIRRFSVVNEFSDFTNGNYSIVDDLSSNKFSLTATESTPGDKTKYFGVTANTSQNNTAFDFQISYGFGTDGCDTGAPGGRKTLIIAQVIYASGDTDVTSGYPISFGKGYNNALCIGITYV